jgi:uncharacterized protein
MRALLKLQKNTWQNGIILHKCVINFSILGVFAMTEPNKTEEPSIEDILGSIRRIIADDPNDNNADGSTQMLEADPSDDSDDVLELTNPIMPQPLAEEPPTMTNQNDIDSMFDTPAPVVAPEPLTETVLSFDEPPAAAATATEELVSAGAAAATAAVMAKLARNSAVTQTGNDGITIEAIVRELLRPMLRAWLDENLPTMVQNMVERELDRITRQVR